MYFSAECHLLQKYYGSSNKELATIFSLSVKFVNGCSIEVLGSSETCKCMFEVKRIFKHTCKCFTELRFLYHREWDPRCTSSELSLGV